MKKLGILGLGLMGGSLGLAARRRRLAESVCGYARRAEVRARALEMGAVDAAAETPEEAVRAADLAVFCVPVLAIPELVARCRPALSDRALLTDVGSTKAELAAKVAGVLPPGRAAFVGSHPIAGSESVGIEAAREGLYEGAMVVVTPAADTPEPAVRALTSFWQALGCRVARMDPEAHDRIVARTSHLPHLVAAMLVAAVCGPEPAAAADFCGTGFLDSTRIAGGSEEIWHDIVKTNLRPVAAELDRFAEVLETVRELLKRRDFEGVRRFLAESRARRRAVGQRPAGGRRAP